MNFIILIGFLFLKFFCKQEESEISFKVINITQSPLRCMSTLGTYLFYIYGEFSSAPNIKNIITLDLAEPSNAKALCYPFSPTTIKGDFIQCEINLCDCNITDKILLSENEPKISGYSFPNWEETIGSNPGISNEVDENITCYPEAVATFNTLNVESNGCNKKNNVLKLNGKWDNDVNDMKFELDIDGYDKKAVCDYGDDGEEYVKCELEGYGDIKINEKYVKTNTAVYLINESNNTVHVDKCENGKFIGINSVIFYSLILLLFI